MSKKKVSASNKKDLLHETLEELISFIKEAKGFAVEQMPDVAKQLLEESRIEYKYAIITNIVHIIVGILALCGCAYVATLTSIPNEARVIVAIVVGLFALVTIGCSIDCLAIAIKDIYQLKAAPKVELIRKIRNML